MTFGVFAFIAAVVVILLCSLFFIGCRRYEDGVVGNFALGFLAIACGVILWDAFNDRLELPAPPYLLMIVSFGAFMMRHAWRFAMFHWHGWFGWARPRDAVVQR